MNSPLLDPNSHARAILQNLMARVLTDAAVNGWTLEAMGANPFTGESAYVTLIRAEFFLRVQRVSPQQQ
jgi:hypothetical protein